MRRRVERAWFAAGAPDAVRLPLCEWLRHHGINPPETEPPGWIERDPAWRRIRYLAVHGCAEQERWVHQLEAVPSPFPPLLSWWLVDLDG